MTVGTTWLPANVTIPDLPVGTTASGTELIEAVQTSGGIANSVQLTINQMLASTITTAFLPGPYQTGNLTAFGVVYGNGTSALGATAAGTTAWALTGNGNAAAPSFAVLTVPGGGTGTTTLTAHGVLIGEGTSVIGITAAGGTNFVFMGTGAGNDPSFTGTPSIATSLAVGTTATPGAGILVVATSIGVGTTGAPGLGSIVTLGTPNPYIAAKDSNGGSETFIQAIAGSSGRVGTRTNVALDVFTNSAFVGRFQISGGFSLGTTADPGAGNIYATNFFNSAAGFTRVASANFTAAASNTTLANITGLSAALGTAVYDFEALVYATASTVGGAKVAIAYSGSVNSIVYQAVCYDGSISTTLLANNGRATASGAAIATCTAAPVPTFRIIGNINATTPGTLTVQIAQAVAATQSTIVLGGSSLKVFQMN